MSKLHTVTELEETGLYAWPGGYPLVFFGQDGTLLCQGCARTDLENGDGPIDVQVEDGGQRFYGGVQCGACGETIVEAECPECMDALFDGTPLMHADNVDASLMHTRCAAKLVQDGMQETRENGNVYGYGKTLATRIPGVGITITQKAWYANVGTVYQYR